MKKILSWLIVLVIISLLSGPIMDSIDTIREQGEIKESKPTQQEITEFQQLLNDNTYYYYNHLNDEQKEAYITMYASFMSFDDSFVIEIDGESLKLIFAAVLYDNPHIFWVDNNYKYIENHNSVSFTPEYHNSRAEAELITAQINDVVEKVVSETSVLNSDYEKELYIHDYVCENTEYDESLSSIGGYSVYDSLIKGKAICEGYSRAMQILLDAVDIDNYLVTGDGESDGKAEPHMWNIVEIDNSNYHLDVTWDDSGTDGSILYIYFNVSDEMIGKDHINISPENNFCFSDSAYFYNVEKSYIRSYNGFSEHASRSAITLKSGENKVEFVFADSTDFENALNDIENDNGFFDYIYSTVRISGRRLNLNKVSYYTIDNQNYLCIIFKEE